MGLDQYAYSFKVSEEAFREIEEADNLEALDEQIRVNMEKLSNNQIGEWRKHPNLEGWMKSLWKKRGGEGEFNCSFVNLKKEDILQLKNDIRLEMLPATSGFFFGQEKDRENKTYDLDFVQRALRAVLDGEIVVYTSWW